MRDRSDVLSTADGRHAGGEANISSQQPARSVLQATGNDRGPDILTITWSSGAFPSAEITPGADGRVVGRLSFGVNAARHVLTFDWGAGGSVTLAASAFELAAEYVGEGPTVHVQASAAYGSKGSIRAGSVLLTSPFTNAGAAGIVVPVPSFARLVTATPSDDGAFTTGLLLLELLGRDGVLRYRKRPGGSKESDAYLIPGEVHFVRVVYSDETPLSGALLWELAL